MSPRILSVFNHLKRVGFAVLLGFVLVSELNAHDVFWVRNGETPQSHFGGLIFPLGDQNDDGYADWMVLSAGSTSEPSGLDDRLDLFHGGSPPAQSPYQTHHPRSGSDAPYMYNTKTIGDFNGDGKIDWVIGFFSPGLDSITLELYGGGGIDTIPEAILRMPYDVGPDRLAALGDHNGDGFDDIFYYRRENDLTYIYFGSSDWDMSTDMMNQGEPIGSGDSRPVLDVHGDLNGDSFEDYLAESNASGGQTIVYWGSELPDSTPDIVWDGNYAFPATLSADLNSDGAADLAISRDPRTIDVHLGGNAPSSIPTYVLNYQGCHNVAYSILSAGDFNHDDYEDIVIVNDPCDNGFGRLCLFLGGPWLNSYPVLEITGLSGAPFDDVPLWNAVGLGDVNGDGIDDMAIGCQGEVLEGRRGRVVIISGDTTLRVDANEHLPVAEGFALSVFPNPFNSATRISLALPPHALGGRLRVHNLLGREVMSQQFGAPAAGAAAMEYVFDGAGLPTGVYLVSVRAGEVVGAVKVMLVK